MGYQIPLMLDFNPALQLDENIVRPTDTRFDRVLHDIEHATELGFDLETYGLDHYDEGLDAYLGKIRLINVGLRNGLVLQLDLGGREGTESDDAALVNRALDVLIPKLEDYKTRIVGQNLKFDALFMRYKFQTRIRCMRDTMLMSQVLWAGIRSYRHGLNAIAARILDDAIDKTEQKSDWSWILTISQRNYGAKDALVVLDVKDKLAERLRRARLLDAARIECDALSAFVEFEYNGMPVDETDVISTVELYESVAAEILAPFTQRFPGVNPNSPKKLIKAIKEVYGITLSGTSQEHLAPLWNKPPIRALTVYRTFESHIEYAKNIRSRMRDGAVRSSFRQMGPKGFGRSTSSKPNLQNPPRPYWPDELQHYNLPSIRSVFKAPPGYKLIIADLSQAHARIACEASQDPQLLRNYHDGLDTHCVTASGIAKVEGRGGDWTAENIAAWKKDKSHQNHPAAAQLRQVAKPTFYGSLNAQSPPTLQKTVKTDANIDMSLETAAAAITGWQIQYNGLYRYQLNRMYTANKTETVIGTQPFGMLRGLSGRRIFLPRWPSKRGGTSVKLSDACNFTWSSTEADAIKWAMGEQGILKQLDEHPEWDATLVNFMHDEVDLLAPEEHAEAVANMVNDYMDQGMQRYIKSIPVNEKGACGSKMLANDWSEK